MSNTAHSHQWQGATSRGNRLSRKLGKRLTLAELETLLAETDPKVNGDDAKVPPSVRRVRL